MEKLFGIDVAEVDSIDKSCVMLVSKTESGDIKVDDVTYDAVIIKDFLIKNKLVDAK